MKKITILALVLLLVSVLAIPAAAVTPSLKPPNIEIPDLNPEFNITIPKSFWDKWFKDHPIIPKPTEPEETEPALELSAPEITTSKYVHASRYVKAYLKVEWTEVEGAEGYEILITKADGETISYEAESNTLYLNNVECPRVYIEKTSTWAAADVQVRAVCGEVVSEWSQSKKISCNKLH